MSTHHCHGHGHHHHAHTHLTSGLLSQAERRTAGRQLILAMLALGLLGLGLVWRWLTPTQEGSARCSWALPRYW